MDLTSVRNIQNLLQRLNLQPRKGLGQNFLVDKRVLGDIIAAADLRPDDVVLEIGPGLGVLTRELAQRAKKVIAVEKDPNMMAILKETLKGVENVEIIQGDAIKDFRNPPKLRGISEIQKSGYKVVANLPYYIVSPVIRQFLELTEARPLYLLLMVQKEVAQRIIAKPPDMNILAVSVQFYAEPKIIAYVSKKSFWPQPKVDSAMIRIVPMRSRTVLDSLFFRVVRAGFSSPRKQLVNNLSRNLKIDKEKAGEWLLQNNIQPSQRAETLSLEDWTKLTESAII